MKKLSTIGLSVLLATAAPVLGAAPVGYSINSDSASENADSLYRIDLDSGAQTLIGPVRVSGQARIDVEGLAFAPDGTLYGIDDSERTLFPINPATALANASDEVHLTDLPGGGSNDFGMTFTCDGTLFITSVKAGTLYRLGLDGTIDAVGSEGDLGANIGALAAWGEPTELYGLGNGLDGDLKTDTPSLFSIDTTTGKATEIDVLGPLAGAYAEGGLAFDDNGQLWAITDRRDSFGAPLPGEVMKLDKDLGTASEVKTLGEAGFESLAITVPRGCAGGGGETARFRVQKQFVDGNDTLPTTLNLRCTSGLPLEQSIVVQPNDGALGPAEVTFVVTEFIDDALDCEVFEDTPEGYNAGYECFSTGDCVASETACAFSGVESDDDNLCVIRNYPSAVDVTVGVDWYYGYQEPRGDESLQVELTCRNVLDGDGEWSFGEMRWSWLFQDGTPDQVATIQPQFDGATECRTAQMSSSSSIEAESSCADWSDASGGLDCRISSTSFFEGIPVLSPSGLAAFVLLMLVSGLAVLRRP